MKGKQRVETPSGNRTLNSAKKAKQDEFYTQYIDIQKEIEAYLEYNPDTFRNKVVYCNCDDPFESNFFKYFAVNFNKLGLKKLITTSYDGSPIASGQLSLLEYTEGNGNRPKPKAVAVIIDQVKDENGDGATNIDDVKLFLQRNMAARKALKAEGSYAGGDFRSPQCVALMKEADIVITNPPFSLFREYIAQIVEHKKQFLIIGNKNAITYKEVFTLIKSNAIWTGAMPMGKDLLFDVPEQYAQRMMASSKNGSSYRIIGGVLKGRSSSIWFTNLDHGRRHEMLPLMTMAENLKFSRHKDIKGKSAYDRYENYDAIEVPFTDSIPSDYEGVMGVPITFLDKYNPDQFEIIGATESEGKGFSSGLWNPESGIAQAVVNGMRVYKRIFIRHRG
ncbi:DNA methyltransferase [Acidithiobacillus caldus]|jgi:hypothetical protein|uniref:adenine-specific methyltransferase EcoRI family protein n=1 Tax=Acidithiobacillus caldus TaxID=33059 RepID=UPI001C06B99A|nr:adenine-specific methyltransferase EcoRI family protein [Acidithiobacillus caldus]MBU2791531.1 DNA methyltransferase [Acidithiobacillus caldus]MBU2822178.1 DNA methyltransferase [Acidithiobacillus caldus]